MEQAGLKGIQIGGARVSPVHTNWLENLGNATTTDIQRLIFRIQNTVKARMGIELEPEVHCLP